MFCRYHRWNIQNALDAGAEPSPRTRRHVGRCAACRRFHDALAPLGRTLRAGEGALPEPPAGMHRRIMTAVTLAAAARTRTPAADEDGGWMAGWRQARGTLAALAVIALLAVSPVFFNGGGDGGAGSTAPAVVGPVPEAASVRPSSGFRVPLESWAKKIRETLAAPCEGNLKDVRRDLRRVASCLESTLG
jgi:hypothetical protein